MSEVGVRIRKTLAVLGMLFVAACSSPPGLPDGASGRPSTRSCEEDERLSRTDVQAWSSALDNQLIPEINSLLKIMSEPALGCGVEPDSYRLIWLPAALGRQYLPPSPAGRRVVWPPTSVRISRTGDTWVATAAQVRYAAGHSDVMAHRQRTLTPAEAEAALTAFAVFDVWRRPDYSPSPTPHTGDAWLVEGRIGGLYHAVALENGQRQAERVAAVMFPFVGLDIGMLRQGVPIAESR